MKKRHYIVGGIGLGILVLWFFFLLSPTLQKRTNIKHELMAAEMQFQDFENIMMAAPEFYKTHEQLKQKRLQITSKLYSKENILSLFREIEDRAQKNQLKVIEITPSVEELLLMNRLMPDGTKPQTLNIVVTLSGELQNMGEFLKSVEAQNFYQGVDLCRISNAVDGERNSKMVFGFKAVLGTIGNS